jgi:hypothetical protein
MTIPELLKACHSGEMPRVWYENEDETIIGRVVQIKNGLDGFGCWVQIENDSIAVWFPAGASLGVTMDDLTLVEEGAQG